MDFKSLFEWGMILAVVLWPVWAMLYALSDEIYKRVKPLLVHAPFKSKRQVQKSRPRFVWESDYFRRLHTRNS